MAKILVVDDDKEILSIIRRALERDGHEVTIMEKATELSMKGLEVYELILLDVMMPKIDGFTLIKQMRDIVDCPILFITAKTMDSDLMEGFSLGADDYIKKPFGIAELRARVSAHIRREHRGYHHKIICGDFRFHISEKLLYIENEPMKLTKSEYEICEYLVKNKGQVFSLEQLVEAILGYDSESDSSAIREHIKNIRAKFHEKGKKPIETVWGIGYKWR